MGLFNGLLGPQNSVNGATAQNGSPTPQAPVQQTVVEDPPIKDDPTAPATTPAPAPSVPMHTLPEMDMTNSPHRNATPLYNSPQHNPEDQNAHIADNAVGISNQMVHNEPQTTIPTTLPDQLPAPLPPTPPSPPHFEPPVSPKEEPPTVSTEKPVTTEDLQIQMDVINSFEKNPSVEALVALMYHKDEYMEALKNGSLEQLLENIRKYNPLVKTFKNSNK